MPIKILGSGRSRFVFRFGRATALRSTSDGVDQLREQLERERQQNRFNMAQMEREKALLIRYLLEAKAELALSMRSLPRRARRHN